MKKSAILLSVASVLLLIVSCGSDPEINSGIYTFDPELITRAGNLAGLDFDTGEMSMMQPQLADALSAYEEMRANHLDNSVAPALHFFPGMARQGESIREEKQWFLPEDIIRPATDQEIAFMTVGELAYLIRTRQISSVELTNIYLDRLKRYGDTLECVITLTENLALEQAEAADREIRAGNYRGPLHGIPYGVKDLLSVKGYKTTWGAAPFSEQMLEPTATVVNRLEEAGAVLVAKLSMGALAMGDLWYGGRTRNPWNPEQGSSGSSAGSASATSAGLVAFAIGTETLGSIVSPSTRCGVTGLRPTFGRVSRSGAMALSWSMDKIGPICRSALDCAIVFDVIRGTDGLDNTVVDMPFNYKGAADLGKMRIGYLKSVFDGEYEGRMNDQAVLAQFRKMGAELVPVELDFGELPLQSMRIILTAEAAAAFDELTRSNLDSLLKGQRSGDWPNTFRAARFIPAVEYIQANRYRTLLMQQMENIMRDFDVVIAPSRWGNQLLVTNLTGHPCVVVPNGFNSSSSPTSISFIGQLYDEASILAVARAYQEATGFDELHPPLFCGKE